MKKRVTIKDISDATGVSKSTISRVITNKGYVDEKTKSIVLNEINRMGYKPQKKHKNKSVQDLVLITSGLLMSPIQTTIMENIIEQLDNQGLKTVISYNKFNTYKLEEYLLYAKERGFAGVIMLGALETPGLAKILKNIDFPVVMLNQIIKGLDIDVVNMDDFQGGYIAAKHLIDYGHKRIGLLMGFQDATAVNKREIGFRQAMADHGLEVIESDVYYGDFTEKSGVEYAKDLVTNQRDITAVISCNDLMSLGLVQELTKIGKRIPKDISIVGFDSSIVTDILNVKLTTVSYDFDKIGITAAKMMARSIGDPFYPKMRISFLPKLSEKNSVSKPKY